MKDLKKESGERPKAGMGFFGKLVLGMTSLSFLGLVTMFVIVNTLVRDVVYDNMLGISQRDKAIQAGEIDRWFDVASQTVRGLATVLKSLSSEHYFATIAGNFVLEYDFIENVFIGFPDGRAINGAGWIAPAGWLSTDRPWYIAAFAAGEGKMVATEPYLSYATGNIAITVSTWLPGLGEAGAAVGAAVSLGPVLDGVSRSPVMANGYLILLALDGSIIFHPSYSLDPNGEALSLRDIPNGGFLMDSVAAGETFGRFDDAELGPSYFTATALETIDWILIAIVPAETIRAPVFRSVLLTMTTFAILLLALFLFAVFLVSRLAGNMEERRTSEERLRSVIDNMPLISNISGRDSSILECNEEATRVFGLRDKREYIERFFELQPSFQPDGRDSREKALEMEAIAFETGQNRFEWMHRHINGEPIPCDVTLVRVKWRGEDQLLSFVQDLRKFHEAQRKEHEMSDRIRLMLDAAPLAIEFWDKNYRLVDCNQTALDFYGFSSKAEFIKSWAKSQPEFQPDGIPTRKKMAWHLKRIFDEGFDSFSFMEQKRSGESVSLEIDGYRMKFNDELVVATYAKDVTELKKATKRMREAEERIQLMLDGVPISCYLVNKDFEAIDCNKETLSLFDFAHKPEGIEKFRDIFSKYRSDKLMKYFDNAIRDGAERFEWILQKPKEGGYIPCEIAFIRFSHMGEYVVAAYIFDLRAQKEMLWERQRVESAEEHSRAKSRFLARISQDIRMPLTAIFDVSESQLQDPSLPPGAGGAFDRIRNSAGALLQIVDDVLDISQMEAGKTVLLQEEYDVADMIGDAARAYAQRSKQIEFTVSADNRIPAFLEGDKSRVKQIIRHLLSNAFKYTSSGTVTLSLQCLKNLQEGYVTLSIGVRDTGQGMTTEQIDELYSEPARSSEREKRSAKGLGLGMQVVYGLVQMMAATINVESELGVGTNVVVNIPQKIAGSGFLNGGTLDDALR